MSWRPKQLVDITANTITTLEPADAHSFTQKIQLSHSSGPLVTLPVRKPNLAVKAFTLPQKELHSRAFGFPSFTLPVQGPFYGKAFTPPLILLGSRFYLPGTDLPSLFEIDPQGTQNKWLIALVDTNSKWLVSSSGKYRITVV